MGFASVFPKQRMSVRGIRLAALANAHMLFWPHFRYRPLDLYKLYESFKFVFFVLFDTGGEGFYNHGL